MGIVQSKGKMSECSSDKVPASSSIECCRHTKKVKNVLPTLTDSQKQLISESWKSVKDDISKVGVITFMNLFETHPDVQAAFMSFKDLAKSEMEHSEVLREHGLRVMKTVDKCVARIETPEKMTDVLFELGIRHISYEAKFEYLELVADQFILSIEPYIGDTWTPDMENAWKALLQIIVYHMTEGMDKVVEERANISTS